VNFDVDSAEIGARKAPKSNFINKTNKHQQQKQQTNKQPNKTNKQNKTKTKQTKSIPHSARDERFEWCSRLRVDRHAAQTDSTSALARCCLSIVVLCLITIVCLFVGVCNNV
jgi:hypothetical protein